MEEDPIVSFETAAILQKKGIKFEGRNKSYLDEFNKIIPAPTQTTLHRYLREKCNVFIAIEHEIAGTEEEFTIKYTNNTDKGKRNDKWYDTYEEALEVGMREELKKL